MKRMVFAALAALLWAGTAWAATETQDGQRAYTMQGVLMNGIVRADTTAKNLTMSSTGGLSTYDESRDRDHWRLFENIIQADSSAGPDSNLVPIVTADYGQLKLLFKIWPINHGAANYTNDIRFAVQIRTHINSATDSMSVFPEYPFGIGITGIGVGGNGIAKGDTLTVGHVTDGSAVLPWSGEFVLNIDGARAAPANGAAANAFSYPNAISIPLDAIYGRGFWAPALSVRMRIISTNSWKWGGTVSVLGTAIR